MPLRLDHDGGDAEHRAAEPLVTGHDELLARTTRERLRRDRGSRVVAVTARVAGIVEARHRPPAAPLGFGENRRALCAKAGAAVTVLRGAGSNAS
jgi:hypothetical protein